MVSHSPYVLKLLLFIFQFQMLETLFKKSIIKLYLRKKELTMKKQCKPWFFITLTILAIFNLLCYFSIRAMWSGIIRYTFDAMPYLLLVGITITADKNGGLWFNDKQVSFKSLGTELSSYDTKKIKKEEFPITLEADADVTNGTIVKIFDIVRQNGYASINLRTSDK